MGTTQQCLVRFWTTQNRFGTVSTFCIELWTQNCTWQLPTITSSGSPDVPLLDNMLTLTDPRLLQRVTCSYLWPYRLRYSTCIFMHYKTVCMVSFNARMVYFHISGDRTRLAQNVCRKMPRRRYGRCFLLRASQLMIGDHETRIACEILCVCVCVEMSAAN